MSTPSRPGTPDPVALPGRIIDIVHAAAQRAGIGLYSFDLTLPRHGEPELAVHPCGDARTAPAARAVFAQLGVTEPALELVTGRLRPPDGGPSPDPLTACPHDPRKGTCSR